MIHFHSFRQTCIRAVCFAVIALVPTNAKADGKRLSVYLSEKHLTPEVVTYLAEVAEPITVKASKGETLDDVVKRACGGRNDKNYIEHVLKSDSKLIAAFGGAFGTQTPTDKKAKIEKDTTLKLPFCLKLPDRTAGMRKSETTQFNWRGCDDGNWADCLSKYSAKPVRVNPGIDFSAVGYLSKSDGWSATNGRNAGGQTALFKKQLEALKAGDTKTAAPAETAFYHGFEEIENVGASVSLTEPAPEFVGAASVKLKPGLDQKRIASLVVDKATKSTGHPDAADKNAVKPEAGPPKEEQLRFFSAVGNEELSAADKASCVDTERPAAGYPFSVAELVSVLGQNRRIPEPRNQEGAKKINIAIIDSGLYGMGSSVFSEAFLERGGRRGREWLIPQSKWQPAVGSMDQMHGTWVASAAIGTPELASLKTLIGVPVKIHVRNIQRGKEDNFSLDGDEITNSLALGLADIVNLSFKRPEPFEHLESSLQPKSKLLYVVAAGNGKRLNDVYTGFELGPELVFPALYGGDTKKGRDNLITVGALRPDGTYTNFSNFGRDYVELAAPGCNIPVYQLAKNTAGGAPSFERSEVNGTSFAAPLVSFTAALIRWQSENFKASDIKDRLLTSADVPNALDVAKSVAALQRKLRGLKHREADVEKSAKAHAEALKELSKKVRHGRRLNIAKALALYHTVLIDYDAAGQRRMVLGDLDSNISELKICGKTRKVSELRKIVPRYINHHEEVRSMVYYVDGAGQLGWTDDCPIRADELKQVITLKRPDTGTKHQALLGDIADLVFQRL